MPEVRVCANCVAWHGDKYQTDSGMIDPAAVGECRMTFPGPGIGPPGTTAWPKINAGEWCHAWEKINAGILREIP